MNDEDRAALIAFPPTCPGCDLGFDPRRHTEKWCASCRPQDGSSMRMPTGSEDARVRLEYIGGCSSDVNPANQRAASALWGQGGAS